MTLSFIVMWFLSVTFPHLSLRPSDATGRGPFSVLSTGSLVRLPCVKAWPCHSPAMLSTHLSFPVTLRLPYRVALMLNDIDIEKCLKVHGMAWLLLLSLLYFTSLVSVDLVSQNVFKCKPLVCYPECSSFLPSSCYGWVYSVTHLAW